MTRHELHEKMRLSGSLVRFGKNNPDWIEAFEKYKKETGDLRVSVNCGSCYEKVKKWLTRP